MNMRFSTLPLWRAMIALGVLSLVLLTGVVGMRDVQATLDVPQILVYQGRLTDEDRITVADGSYSMIFTIYSDLTGGSCLWTAAGSCGTPTAVSVTVTDGIFTYNLGSGALPFGDELFEDDASVYLGVTIGSDSEMTPRRQIGSAAYAMHAGDSDLLDDLNTSSTGCTSACVPVTSSAGNLVITGDPQSTTVGGGSIYINPAAAGAGETLFGVALNGASRFTVDEDGDATLGSNNSTNVSLWLYNSNNTYGTITGSRYSTYDSIQIPSVLESTYGSVFSYNGLQVSVGTNTAPAVYIDETAFDGAVDTAGSFDNTGLLISTSTSAYNSGAGTFGASGIKGRVGYAGAGTGSALYGSDMRVTSTPSGTLPTAYGAYSLVTHSTNTLTSGYGTYGEMQNAGGTLTNAYGVYGYANEASGTTTTGYGGYFRSVGAGTNYAIYTADGRVQIEGDATATTPTVATSDGELFVLGDIESDADIVAESQLAVGTTPGANDLITTLDTLAFSAGGTNYGMNSVVNMSGDGFNNATAANDTNVYGSLTTLNVSLTAGVDEVKALLGQSIVLDHKSNDASGRFTGSDINIDGSAGTITSAIGQTIAIGTSGGAITDAVGLMIDSDSGTDTGLYVGHGYVHVDNAVYGSKTTPTLTGVGSDGTMFVEDNVEIYDGALCVGDGSAGPLSPLGDCANAAGADGVIYSIAASVTQHDLAESFPSNQFLLAGEIVSADPVAPEYVARTTGASVILGAVSTNPGLVLGWGGDNEYPVALTGRTPVKVNDEGGAIAIGDRITISSAPGIGKKATGAGEVVGVAMESFGQNGSGAIMAFILPQWWDGVAVTPSVTEQEPEPVVQPDRVLVMEDGFIKNIMGLQSGGWSVDFDGAFVTEGQYGVLIRGNDGKDVTAYGMLSTQQLVTLMGTTKMEGKMAEVKFEDVDPLFNDVIAPDAPITITATVSNGSGTVSIRRKDTNGFEIWRESGTGDEVDWVAMAYRVGKAPKEDEEKEEVVDELVDDGATDDAPPSAVETTDTSPASGEEEAAPVVEPIADEPVGEETTDDAVEIEPIEPVADEPTAGEPMIEEPASSPNVGEVSESDEDGGEAPIVVESVIEEVAVPSETP